MLRLETSFRRPVTWPTTGIVPRILRVQRARATSRTGAIPPDGPNAVTVEPPTPQPQPAKSTADLAKEALMQTIKSEATTAQDVLGEATMQKLRQVMGEERAGEAHGRIHYA
jgi:hypothetical protein